MPQRLLKPGIKTSMNFNACSDAAQNVFMRLVTEVDDYALMDAHPQVLAGVLYPLGNPLGRPVKAERMEQWLNELAANKMILLYESAGKRLLHILRWTERNRMQNPSRFPAPPAGSCGCEACRRMAALLPASASICQQMTADDGRCRQLTPNAALPIPSRPEPDPVPISNKNGAGLEESRTQFAALSARVKEATAQAKRGELGDMKLLSLKKMRAALGELQKKQARGDFSRMDLMEFGL